MKKFYSTLALAAAVALSASAADYKALEHNYELKSAAFEKASAVVEAPALKAAPAVAKATPSKVEDIYGYYQMTYINGFTGAMDTGMLALNKGEKANEVSIVGFFEGIPVYGTFNPANATLSIASNQLVYNHPTYGQVFWQHVWFEGEGEDADIVKTTEPLVCYFDENGELIIPGHNGYVQGWIIGLDDAELSGFGMGMVRETERLQAPDNADWDNYGQATLNDGWFLPGFGQFCFKTPVTDFPAFDVKLQRNKTNPNLYRLYDPYSGLNEYLGAEEDDAVNISPLVGVIEFNVSDPACVVVTPGLFSGLDSPWIGGPFYMYNLAGDYICDQLPAEEPGLTYEEYVETFKAYMESEGATKELSTYNADARMVTINDARVVMTYYPGVFTWNQFAEDFGENATVNMTSVILLPDPAGLNNIITDNSNNTLEYFNLQGVRVNNPSNGIYIRRQGNDVQKVYVR